MSENFILPFQLEQSRIRGRIVRMDNVLDDILAPHAYPQPVSHMVGEVTVLCALLSSMLKFDGIFTLQVQSEGDVRMLVSDLVTGGNLRACATFDSSKDMSGRGFADLIHKGYMAFTVDQGQFTERYQGIVELKPEGLMPSVLHYFTQSEQIATGIVMHVGQGDDGRWRGCGIMVQQMPEETARYNRGEAADENDDWQRTMVLLGSVKREEMLSPEIPAQDLLYRLFHEEGVRTYSAQPLQKVCRCSREKLMSLLSTMSSADIQDMVVDGGIKMTCEFCSTDYVFDPNEIQKGEKTT